MSKESHVSLIARLRKCSGLSWKEWKTWNVIYGRELFREIADAKALRHLHGRCRCWQERQHRARDYALMELQP